MDRAGMATATLLYVLLAVLALWQSGSRPVHNWDMIGYIAAAKSFEESDPAELHRFTYRQLREWVAPSKYRQLATGNGNVFRRTMGEDAAAFAEQLPFYQIRPAYTGLIYVFYKAGIPLPRAIHLVSGLAIALASGLLLVMAMRFLSPALVFALPPLALVFGVVNLARLSTPDALALLFMVLSALLVMTGSINSLVIVLAVMMGVRTDLILFALPLLGVRAYTDSRSRWKLVLGAAVCVAAYVSIMAAWHGHSWSTTFYFTLVHAVTHPASMPPELTVRDYLSALSKGAEAILTSKILILYVLSAAYTFGLLWAKAKVDGARPVLSSPLFTLSVGLACYVASHFVLFPVVWDRFYSAPAVLGAFALSAIVTVSMRHDPIDQAPASR